MDYFPDGLVVRLWSPAHGAYLHADADADGVGVSLRQHRGSSNAEWEVRRVRRDGAEFFFLRSAATGRCLALSPPGHRAIQRDDGEPDQRGFFWKAFMAGDGAVVLKNAFYYSNLRASGWNRSKNNGVTAGNKDGATTADWLVEAALPPSLSPAPPATPAAQEGPPKLVCLRVPRLGRERLSGAKLPLLGDRNVLAGYVAARSVLGLVEVMQGTGEFLRAPEGVLRSELGGGQLPHELTALAFVGRGSGIRVLPLLVLADDANGTGVGDEAGDGNDGAEGGVAGGNHDGVGHHGNNADADQRGAGAEEQTVEGHGEVFQGAAAMLDVLPLNAAELEAGAAAQGVANAEAHRGERGDAVVGAGAAVLQGGAGPREAGLPAPVQAAAAAPGNPAVLGLQKLYGGLLLLRKRHLVQQLVQQLNDMEEHARAEGTRPDWKETRAIIRDMVEHIGGVKHIKGDITKLLAAMEGDAAPAPPSVMEEDPEEWVPASVRRRLRRGG